MKRRYRKQAEKEGRAARTQTINEDRRNEINTERTAKQKQQKGKEL